ncbi:TRAP transporter small permease [bacterium]|nr:TRAP transporter small permease [bacterium]
MKFADILRDIDKVIHRILLIVAQVALFAMITIVCVTVFYRYVLNKGIIWAEETPRTLVALFAFIACAMGVRDHLHIGVGFFYNRFKEGGIGRKILDIVYNLSTFACGSIMTFYGWNLCTQLWRFTMPATGLPRTVQYISMPIAGAIIMFDSLLFLFGVLKEDDLLYTEKEQELKVLHVKRHGGDKPEEKKA